MFIELFGNTFQETTGKTDELFIFVTINLLCGQNRIITNKFDVRIVLKSFLLETWQILLTLTDHILSVDASAVVITRLLLY